MGGALPCTRGDFQAKTPPEVTRQSPLRLPAGWTPGRGAAPFDGVGARPESWPEGCPLPSPDLNLTCLLGESGNRGASRATWSVGFADGRLCFRPFSGSSAFLDGGPAVSAGWRVASPPGTSVVGSQFTGNLLVFLEVLGASGPLGGSHLGGKAGNSQEGGALGEAWMGRPPQGGGASP